MAFRSSPGATSAPPRWLLAALTAAAIAFGQAAWAQSPGRTLVEPDVSASRAALDQGVTRSQPVSIDLSILGQIRDRLQNDPSTPQQVVLPTFNGPLTLSLTRTETVGDALALHGTVVGVPMSSVVLVEREGIVAGNINAREFNYQIRYRGPGFGHELRDFDQSRFRDHDREPVGPRTPEGLEAPAEPGVPETAAGSGLSPSTGLKATQADDGSMIDVMVAYTPAARDGAGGTAGMLALIALGETETNAAYASSGVIQRIRVVHKVELTYTESGDFGTDLNRARGKTDGFMDNLHTLRDQYGADLVSVWIEDASNICGIAAVMTTVSASFESAGFSVVNRPCATGYYSFGHELGHNMGLLHDTYVDSGVLPFAYAHGYADPTHSFRTIMGYNNACAAVSKNCNRIQYFSNPAVNFNGFTTGNAASANSKLALDNTRVTIANFRASLVAMTPAITSANNVTFYVGLPGSFTVTATGDPAPTLAMAGAVPGTIAFAMATGVLSGTSTVLNIGVYPLVFTASNGAPANATQNFTLTVAAVPPCTLDIDGDGKVDPLTDGLLLMRAMSGLTGTQVTVGAIGAGAPRKTWAQISPVITPALFDLDGNGRADAATDGLMLIRAMFGLTGTQVTTNALGLNPTRATWPLIRAYLNTTCGGTFAP